MKVGINALSARAGGGLVYLSKLIFYLRHIDKDNEYYIFLTRNNRGKIIQFDDARFHIVEANVRSVAERMIYEQVVLPVLLNRFGIDVIYAPADVAPLFAPCKVVLGIQNPNIYYPNVVQRALKERIRLKILRWLAGLSARKATKVVFVSRTSASDIGQKLDLPEAKRIAIWHGVESDRFSPQSRVLTPRSLFPANRVNTGYVLCISNISRHKNIEVLLRGYSMLDRAFRESHQLVIVGRISHGYLEELSSLTLDLGCAESVIFAGEVSHDMVPSVYRNAVVVVLPSLLETFGIPLIEAMASGIPVVASSTSVLPEIVGDAGLLFEPRNPADLAQKIRTVAEDLVLRNTLIEKGLQRSRLFTWERCARETLAVLNECSRV